MGSIHTCPSCQNVKHIPELNDDLAVNPSINLDELVRIEGHGNPLYRVLEIKGVQLLLEKI